MSTTDSGAQARENAGFDGMLNARNWTCYPLSAGSVAELVTSTSVQMDRGVDALVDEIDDRILVAIGGGDSAEERYRFSSATQLLHYNATAGSSGAYGAHTDCHDFRGNRVRSFIGAFSCAQTCGMAYHGMDLCSWDCRCRKHRWR